MLLVALAVVPGIAVCLFIYSLSKYDRSVIRYLVVAFLLGMVATLPALAIQTFSYDVRNDSFRHSVLSYLWYAFIVVALSEEGGKYLVLRLYAYPKAVFKEPFDGIVFAVMIGMGFATVENIEYVIKFGLETAVSRAFLAIPAHAAFAVLMGYPVGRAKFEEGRSWWLMGRGLLIAVVFHGSFDFFLFFQQSRQATKYFSTGVLSFGAFASFYIAVRMAMRALRLHRAMREAEEEEAYSNQTINHRPTENDG